MQLRKLKTKKDYSEALARFEEIFQAKAGTKESDEADVLSMLIKNYEDEHYVFETPSPIEAIKFRMEQKGITNKELATILGYKSRVTDIFNLHRKLNLNMVRKLHYHLNIPLEALIKEY
ncbi:MAG: transcriptional regulator [Crocinitomicaceae bacterium]|nr:transcriptional regulator [Crocinitomicaceae bacterium]MBK8924528.1 transcriptional regulator [Crocinitomicaceae bacterium]